MRAACSRKNMEIRAALRAGRDYEMKQILRSTFGYAQDDRQVPGRSEASR